MGEGSDRLDPPVLRMYCGVSTCELTILRLTLGGEVELQLSDAHVPTGSPLVQ